MLIGFVPLAKLALISLAVFGMLLSIGCGVTGMRPAATSAKLTLQEVEVLSIRSGRAPQTESRCRAEVEFRLLSATEHVSLTECREKVGPTTQAYRMKSSVKPEFEKILQSVSVQTFENGTASGCTTQSGDQIVLESRGGAEMRFVSQSGLVDPSQCDEPFLVHGIFDDESFSRLIDQIRAVVSKG